MANIKLKSISVGENIIVSSPNGQISVINIVDIITSKGFPALHPKLGVLVRVVGDVGTYQETLEIISVEDEKIIATAKGNIEIKNKDEGNNFAADFVNVPFPKPGKYWLKVSVDGEILTDKSIHFIDLRPA